MGYRALGRRFNTWMYRVRREVFLREAGALDLDWPRTRVLDVGSGTGFYIQAWRDLGAGWGRRVRPHPGRGRPAPDPVPNVRFHRLDIAEPGDLLAKGRGLRRGLLHGRALPHHRRRQIRRRPRPSPQPCDREGTSSSRRTSSTAVSSAGARTTANRTLEWITDALDEAGGLGCVFIRRTPMLVLMNAQVDAGPGWRRLWGGTLRAATVTEATGWLAGAALYPLERRLVRTRSESPTTEIMVSAVADDDARAAARAAAEEGRSEPGGAGRG